MVSCDKLWNSCKDSYCHFWEMPKRGKSERRDGEKGPKTPTKTPTKKKSNLLRSSRDPRKLVGRRWKNKRYATGTTITTTLDNGIHIENSSFLPLNLYFEKLCRVWRKTNPSTLSSIMDLQDNLVFPIQAKPNNNSLPSLTFGSKDTAIKLCMVITMIDVVMAFFLFS